MSGWAQREAERKEDEANEMDELITEVRELRAELAAAKERGDGLYLGLRQTLEALGGVAQPGVSEAFLILGVPGEAAAIKRVNTALAADNERLRKALELGECYMKVFRHELARNNATFEGSEDQAEVDGDLAKVQAALAATPAQSLAAHDAAAKRLRSQVCEYRDNHYLNSDQNADSRARHEVLMSSLLLAAQALEAWSWMAENGISPDCRIRSIQGCATAEWRILGRDQCGHLKYYYADTPLGAVLAAMEGEAK